MLTGHRTPILMTYDANDCLVKEHHTLPGGNRDVIRAYDKDSRETSVTCGSAKVEKAFDELGRLSSIKRNGGKHVTEFTYAAAPDGGATGRVKGADYYYIRDGLMCITGLVDANGGAVVNYRFDSWGKLISITGSMADTLGKDNPYRYKGYYYDDETGMYYLKSRYYQPEICRFIIARAMGQEFGVKDVAVAAVLGAVGGICGGYRDWRKYIGAAANGIYVGTVAYRSGANLGASLVSGGIAAFFSASGIGDLASLPLVDEGKIVAGNVLATGSIDLVVNTGYTGMSSAISTAASSSHKSTISSRNRNSKKNNYMRNMRPRKVFDKWIRKGGHIYHVWKYLYHGKLYTRWEKLR